LPQHLDYAAAYTVMLEAGAVKDLAGNAAYAGSVHFESGLSQVAVNLTGTDGSDTLQGSDFDDTISGGGGNDVIRGHGGNDLLTGSDIADYAGGAGDDRIQLSVQSINGAATHIDAGEGNDRIDLTLYGHTTGQVSITGGSGSDTYVLHAPAGTPGAGARV